MQSVKIVPVGASVVEIVVAVVAVVTVVAVAAAPAVVAAAIVVDAATVVIPAVVVAATLNGDVAEEAVDGGSVVVGSGVVRGTKSKENLLLLHMYDIFIYKVDEEKINMINKCSKCFITYVLKSSLTFHLSHLGFVV